MNSTSHLHLTGTEKADRLPGQRTSETLLLLTGSQKAVQFKLVYSTEVAESRLHLAQISCLLQMCTCHYKKKKK